MSFEQQSETYDFFNSTAKTWQQKATSKTYNVIENRHAAVLEIMNGFAGEPAILDVGCGTGQLAIEASKRGWVNLFKEANYSGDYCFWKVS